jgi:hypothetical protein
MNNQNLPVTSEIENLQTPYCLGPECDPREYLPLGQWPGLPVRGLKAVVPAPLKKLVTKLLADKAEATAARDTNNVAAARRQMLVCARDGSDYGAIEAERISREIQQMDLEAFGSAVTKIREIDNVARAAVLEFLPTAAAALLETFVEEAKLAEGRLLRYGRPLSSTASEMGYIVTRWELWRDEIVAGLFADFWFCRNLWPVEFAQPRLENREPLNWLTEIVAEG